MNQPLAEQKLGQRNFVATVLAAHFLSLLVLLAACHQGSEEPPKAAPSRSSVLLITLDTTRADHLSCYGGPHAAKTPSLDRLAARGVRFAHATAQVPLTLPSHACIMTGSYPPVHGLRDMGGFVLQKTHPTMASVAQAAGMETAAFVGSRVLSSRFGLSNGFATYDDEMGARREESGLPGVFPERRAAEVTDHAIRWLKAHASRRFFLWAHYYDPHAPYDPPEPYRSRYASDLYSGEIAYTDEQVGRLLDELDREGISQRTLVVVIGDHGESLGEHGELTHGVFLYEPTLHIPLIMAGPRVPAGRVIDDQVRSIDVMPTILEFLGLSPGAEAQGTNLWPEIEQERKVRSNYAYLETLYPRTYLGWSELRAMRTDEWKLIVAPRPELYDLAHDPEEKANVIARFPADADRLQKKIWEIVGKQARREVVASTPIDTATRQELESLGYVSAGTPRAIELGTNAPDAKDRTDVLKLLEVTEKLLNAHAYARAAELMETALRRDPTNPLAMIYLAMACEKQHDDRRAVQVYEHALSLKIETDQIYSRLGRAWLRLRNLPKAVEAMERANQLNPTDLDNLRNLGTAYLQVQPARVQDAERAFKAILVQNDRYAAAYNGLGLVAIQHGDAETARANFQKAVDLDPNEFEPLLNLGVLYQKTGNRELALRYLSEFLARAPRDQYGSLFPDVRAAIKELKGGG